MEAKSNLKSRQLSVSIGVMAFNEERNIGGLLRSIISQRAEGIKISEIIVISSGSTDHTDKIVAKLAQVEPKIKLIVQKKRSGKASAVNVFIAKAKSQIIVLSSADLIWSKSVLAELIEPFKDRKIGMVGAHPVPTNDPSKFFGFANYLLWKLHDKISYQNPKMGEVIAFRKIFRKISQFAVTDEANVEPLIKAQDYKIIYASKAIVHNHGPENLAEFVQARRRVFCGHMQMKHNYSYEVATVNAGRLFWLTLQNWEWNWRWLLWTPLVVGLEAYCRLLGYLDFKYRLNDHVAWRVNQSTKAVTS